MSFRKSVFFLSVLLVASAAWAGQKSQAEPEKCFMWSVERGSTTVYLLGSIHVLKEDAYPLPQAIDRAFDDAEVVVFEVDLDDMSAAALKMLAAGTLEGDENLEEVVGPTMWLQVSEHMKSAGLQPAAFQRMKPWMVALSLSAFELARAGYTPGAGLDTRLDARAKAAGKERLALETVDFQVGIFTDLDPVQSVEFLKYTLRDLDTVIPLLDELATSWRVGDVKPVEELLLDGFEESPELFEKLVTKRNQSWLGQVEELIGGDRDALVVVGALHLVGDGGLVALLRDKGYVVEQR
ncbi:MAG: TraB/GumN family protein [Acidobacteriota bacterium]